jgi:cellulose synthase/poly-beta-1,6-N-acetylglucosamine synthase-like glycosyltransferase
MGIPFTAARARNTGFRRLLKERPQIAMVQFVDGDCILEPDWLKSATAFLENHSSVGAVCGRRKELLPHASIYNKLCDMEWNTPVGESRSCGGDALFLTEVMLGSGGYRDSMIAGEEPELCFRLRQKGWKICRLDEPMTLHDANITRISQWWKRAQRAGYAYMSGALLHGKSSELYNIRPVLRISFWGAILPLFIILLSAFVDPLALIMFLLYPAQWLRIANSGREPTRINLAWAFYNLLGKFAELSGVLQCLCDAVRSRNRSIIEYK